MRRVCPLVLFFALALLLSFLPRDVVAAQEDQPSVTAEDTQTESEPVEGADSRSQEMMPGPSETSADADRHPPAPEEGALEGPAPEVEEGAVGEAPTEVEEEAVEEPAPEVEEGAIGEPPTEVEEEAVEELPTEVEEEAVEPLGVPAPIVSIDIVGNEHIPKEDIEKAVTSEVGGPFSEGQVARDRQAIRTLGWFERVSVERESVEDGIRLVFRVVENPLIMDIRFDGVSVLTPDDLLQVMKTQPGQVYNGPLLAEDAIAVEQLYRSQGYILAMVLEPRMSDEGVLTLVMAEGEIEDIRITGNTHTKTYAIRRYVRTQPGEAYNDRKVAGDVRKLNSLGWFETVRRDAEVGTEPGKVIVVITVVEKRRTGMVSVGGGYSSVQGFVGFVDLTKGNLGGNGQAVSIRGEFGGRTSYELGYRHPWVATPETALNVGVYDRLILREAFVAGPEDERLSILYDERRIGSSITLGRPLSDVTTVFLGFRSDDVSISGVPEEEEEFLTGAAFEPRRVRSITLAAVNDTRLELFNPRRGLYQRFSAEFAGLVFGGTEFNKYVVDGRRFFPVAPRITLAMRLLAGTISGDPPYLEQFLVGGGETLRGYRNDRFVGTNMAIVNTEFRVPVGENLLGVLFVDVGDAWGRTLDFDPELPDVVDESFKARVGYGAGVRVRTPIGPLRLDIGFSEEGTETHFGLRNMF